jgi:hypothetical protein
MIIIIAERPTPVRQLEFAENPWLRRTSVRDRDQRPAGRSRDLIIADSVNHFVNGGRKLLANLG